MDTAPHSLAAALADLQRRYGAGVIRRGDDPMPASACSTGLPAIDQLLPGGGLPRGRLVVIAAEGQRPQPHRSTGRLSLLGALLARATADEMTAYVDLPGTLDPGFLFEHNLDAERCLVVRPPGGTTAPGLAMARTLVRAGVGWVAVALPTEPGREALWQHPLTALVEAAHAARATLVAAASAPLPPALAHAASLVLSLTPAGWHRRHGVVLGQRVRLAVTKNKLGAPGASTDLLINYPLPFNAAGISGVPTLMPSWLEREYAVFLDEVNRLHPQSA